MRKTINHLAPIAGAIHNAVLDSREGPQLPDLPTGSWRRYLELLERTKRARLYGWTLAADRLAKDFGSAVCTLASQLNEHQRIVEQKSAVSDVSSYRDIYRDLVELEQEFEELDYDRSRHQMTVRTEPIELEGFDLGPFEIRLDLGRLQSNPSYRVVALEPNPAVSRHEVTHPHVMDELLCEGEGRVAIRKALVEGRLVDFFQLVAGILRTYNDESPYIELADWSSESCCDCGTLTHPEYGFCCPRCESWLCYECEGKCICCGEGYCHQCLAPCKRCEDLFCPKCLETCSGCLEQICPACLTTDERCGDCHEEESKECESNAPAEVLSYRLSQASIST